MTSKLTFGSLFAGIGGFDLGLERAGMECRWQVEIDDFCNRVLEKHWPNVRRYRDVREVGKHNLERVDVVSAGVPCQPVSIAGKRRGTEDDRWLWPEALRIVSEVRPAWVVFENPPGIDGMGLCEVLSDLAALGYETAPPLEVPAVAVDADHLRRRIFIVANACGERKNGYGPGNVSDENWDREKEECRRDQFQPRVNGHIKDASDAYSARLPGRVQTGANGEDAGTLCAGNRPSNNPSCRIPKFYWQHQPIVGGRLHGISDRMDRIRSLGNAVVPQITEMIGRAIVQAPRPGGEWRKYVDQREG